MRMLIKEDNTIECSAKKILLEQRKFYSKLYKTDPTTRFMYENDTQVKVTPQDRDRMDKPITIEEFSQALYTLKNGKAPGSHGLQPEVYKMFWTKIKKYCYEAFTYAISNGLLHSSTCKGILCLIPKKDKPPEYIRNWRPLTLLNTDHKIFTKVLAHRIKPTLKYLISYEQTGYMDGRFIGLNLRKLIDTLSYIEQQEIPGVLISVDFEKCFDSIEFTAIKGALKFFDFGPNFIKYVQLSYNQFTTYVLQNGFLSDKISPTRGIHQGCSISGYLY